MNLQHHCTFSAGRQFEFQSKLLCNCSAVARTQMLACVRLCGLRRCWRYAESDPSVCQTDDLILTSRSYYQWNHILYVFRSVFVPWACCEGKMIHSMVRPITSAMACPCDVQPNLFAVHESLEFLRWYTHMRSLQLYLALNMAMEHLLHLVECRYVSFIVFVSAEWFFIVDACRNRHVVHNKIPIIPAECSRPSMQFANAHCFFDWNSTEIWIPFNLNELTATQTILMAELKLQQFHHIENLEYSNIFCASRARTKLWLVSHFY